MLNLKEEEEEKKEEGRVPVFLTDRQEQTHTSKHFEFKC